MLSINSPSPLIIFSPIHFYKIEKTGPKSLFFKAFRPVINIICTPVAEIKSALFSPDSTIFRRLAMNFTWNISFFQFFQYLKQWSDTAHSNKSYTNLKTFLFYPNRLPSSHPRHNISHASSRACRHIHRGQHHVF